MKIIKKIYDLIVVGAGPAGMIAAGIAKEKGLDVIILEKMTKPCLKLGITGKGRCNLTNVEEKKGFLDKFGKKGGRFLKHSLYTFDQDDLIAFFIQLKIKLIKERGGRVFPETGKALHIVGALKDWIRKKNVDLILNKPVYNILIEEKNVIGIICKNGNTKEKIFGKTVILSTGGKSYPFTGSTGDGYLIAETAGHTIKEIRPSLIPVETNIQNKLTGLNLRNIQASIILNNKIICKEFGELLFMEYGVSGPVILTMSKRIVELIEEKSQIDLSIDLKPALSHKKLENRLLRDFSKNPGLTIESALGKLVPVELINICLSVNNIASDTKVGQITSQDRKKLRLWLKDFRMKITGYRPIEEAIITSGGINLNEVNSKTMESKIANNLFFAGEILDIDAKTGGYNLQAAFSTGYLAGLSVVNKLMKP